MGKNKPKFKKGAASFYIVAFSTLILLIVATSFAAVIISEITRTSNDDLSQSAYDSSMAGIEDAKLAFFNYQNCLNDGSGENCALLKEYMHSTAEEQDCDMIARILGKIGEGEEGKEVIVEEANNASNNMQQAYTCVKMQTLLRDYRSTLSSTVQTKVVKAKFNEPVTAKDVNRVRISWYETAVGNYRYSNIKNDGKVVFPNVGSSGAAVPPTISLALVQTAETFNLSDFDMTIGDRTDRGMVYLVPTTDPELAKKTVENNHYGGWNGSENRIVANAMLKSNDKTATNLPYTVYCDQDSTAEFVCSAVVELPEPVGGARSDETFMIVMSLPYGKPSTDFALEFLCRDGVTCGKEIVNEEGETTIIDQDQAYLDGVQVEVDSTGRANDLYRRLRVRLESEANSSFLSMMGPLELLGDNSSGSELLRKTDVVTCEYNFGGPTC